MNVQIIYSPDIQLNDSASFDLEELSQMIEQEVKLEAKVQFRSIPGSKSIGFAESITIANLLLTSIATLVSVLSYWNATKKEYSVEIKKGQSTITIKNLSEKEILKFIENKGFDDLEIIIH